MHSTLHEHIFIVVFSFKRIFLISQFSDEMYFFSKTRQHIVFVCVILIVCADIIIQHLFYELDTV